MSSQPHSLYIDSPVGVLKLEATGDALTAIKFVQSGGNQSELSSTDVAILNKTKQQLEEYFNGNRKRFDLSLAPAGTAFEQDVWKQLKGIPYGQKITYMQLAQKLGDSNKVRAVGRANGQNPLPIVIPCHRVIGANDKLTGYGGGIERKRWLLRHEGVLLL